MKDSCRAGSILPILYLQPPYELADAAPDSILGPPKTVRPFFLMLFGQMSVAGGRCPSAPTAIMKELLSSRLKSSLTNSLKGTMTNYLKYINRSYSHPDLYIPNRGARMWREGSRGSVQPAAWRINVTPC